MVRRLAAFISSLVFFLLVFSVAVSSPARAASAIDQKQEDEEDSTAVSAIIIPAQTFTPSKSGNLTALELYLYSFNSTRP